MMNAKRLMAGGLFAAAILAALLYALFDAASSDPRRTAAAAVFSANFPDLDGKMQPLAQWKGRVLVLNFWAPWCPPCRREIPAFIQLQDKYRAQGVVFVGLALDQKEPVKAFVEGMGVNYPTLLGDEKAADLGRRSGNRSGGLPFTLVVGRSGKVALAWTGVLPEEKLEEALKPLL